MSQNEKQSIPTAFTYAASAGLSFLTAEFYAVSAHNMPGIIATTAGVLISAGVAVAALFTDEPAENPPAPFEPKF